MTSLDQAFIRAFSQQGTLPAVPPRQPAGDCPNFRVGENGTVPFSAAAVPSIPEVAPLHISDVFRDVLATLEKPPARPKNPEKAEALAAVASWRPEDEADTGSWMADWCQTSVGMAEPFNLAEPIVLAESVGLPESVDLMEPVDVTEPADAADSVGETDSVDETDSADAVGAAVELPCQREPQEQRVAINNQQSPIINQPSAIDNPQSPVAPLSFFPQLPPATEPVAPSEFKPAWQVERFTWPRVCRRLMARAAEEFDRLADALLAANARGQKVLGMAGCCRGEGATTLLLCAARRIAERGVKLVLVDADLGRPRLAKRLGVQPQAGWNELSGEDKTFLANAVVEAAANNMALSGIREPASPNGRTRGDWSRLAPCIETLKRHYEMVLVDLGPLEGIESLGDVLGQTVGGKIDAVLLVHNPRITSEAQLTAVEEQLTASGIALAGLIENFVAE